MIRRIASGIASRAASVESLFALFLFAGVVKDTPAFGWFPVDLTVIALAGSLVAAVCALRSGRWRVPRHALWSTLGMVAFAVFVIVSLAWSPGREYAGRKALHVAVMCGWSYAGAALVVSGDRVRLRRFFGAMVVLAAVTAVQVVWLMARNPIVASEAWGRSYLGFGRLFGVATLAVVGWLLWTSLGKRATIGALAVLAVLATGLMVGGGRGPLLATTAALAVPLGIGVKLRDEGVFVDRRIARLAAALVLAVLLVLVIGQAGVFLRTVQRLVVLLTEGDAQSFGRRLWYYQQVPGLWAQAPFFGHGIGAWPLLIGWGDVRAYPHNLVFELLVELGIAGLALFGGLFAASLRGMSRSLLKASVQARLVAMLVIAATVNAMISGDLTDNRLLFAALGLSAGLPRPRSVVDV